MRCFHGFRKYREIGSLSNEPGNSQVLSGKFPELGLTEYTVGCRGSKGNLAGVSKGQECWLDRVTALVSCEHRAHRHHEAHEDDSPSPPWLLLQSELQGMFCLEKEENPISFR